MAQRTVGSTKGKVVGEVGHGDAEVGRHALFAAPEVPEVGAVGDEGEAWQPGGVEACGADDHVDLMGVAFVVGEARGRDAANGVGEDGHVVCCQCLQVAWSGRWSATAYVKVLGDDFVD